MRRGASRRKRRRARIARRLLSLLSLLSLRALVRAQDLTSVRDIMTQNIQDVLGRGEALDCAPVGG